MENLKRISDYDELNKCLKIIHIAYKKRDQDLGLDENNNLRHSYVTFEKLKELYDNGIEMYGYYLDGRVVGFVSIDIREKEIKIKDIVVLPEFQNKGIGRLLLDFVKDETKKNNKQKIILGMIYDNEKLRIWYEKYGFNITKIVQYPNVNYKTGYMEYIVED